MVKIIWHKGDKVPVDLICKKISLDPGNLGNIRPISIFLFLSD